MTRTLCFLAGCVLLHGIFAADIDGKDRSLVRDISRLDIRGLRSFSAAHVKKELGRDSEVILAAHAMAPLVDLPAAVSRGLTAGFQRAGFADAHVRTEIEANQSRLIATVTEGPRFLNGKVQIKNLAQVDLNHLTDRLTRKYAPREAVTPVFDETESGQVSHWLDKDGKKVDWEDPVWATDQPSQFDPKAQDRYQKLICHALEDLGLRGSKFQISLKPNRETLRAHLHVDFQDEGSLARLKRITVRGNQQNSANAIVDYLNLSTGAVFSRRRATQARFDLWRSGRFASTDVKINDAYGGGHELILTMKESPYSPPINQLLTREEQTLLKMRQWLADSKRWHGDMVFRTRSENDELTLVVAAGGGAVFSWRWFDTEPNQTLTLVGSRHEIGCYPSQSNIHIRADSWLAAVLALNLTFRLNDDLDRPDKPFVGSYSFGISTNDKTSEASFQMGIQAEPAACLAIANTRNAKSSWEGDRLTIESDMDRLEIDGRSGRLIRHTGRISNYTTELVFKEGEFDRAVDAVHRSAIHGENAFDARQPLRSIFEFLLCEPIVAAWSKRIPAKTRKEFFEQVGGARGASKFISMGVLDPLDEFLTKPKSIDKSQDEFKIPDPVSDPESPKSWIQQMAFALVPISDDLFPTGSWPWTVWREASFVAAGRGRYTGQQLQHIYESDEFGPVGILVVAMLLDRMNQKPAQLFADRGTRDMSTVGFRKDYLPLLNRDCISGKVFLRACEILRALNDSEFQHMLGNLQNESRGTLAAFRKELQRESERPITEAIPAALDVAWENGLRATIEQMLADIRDDKIRLGRR